MAEEALGLGLRVRVAAERLPAAAHVAVVPADSAVRVGVQRGGDAGASAEPDWKLPPLAEVSEHGGTVPGSAVSDASDGSAAANKAAKALRRHESGSFGSSSNFSFAFPMYVRPAAGTIL